MLSASTAISRTRRGITLGTAVRVALWAMTIAAALAGPMVRSQSEVALTLLAIGGIWTYLSIYSARNSRLNAEFPHLVAAGQFDAAESVIDRTLRSFSLFRPMKLAALHQLAVLRHAQDRHQDAAALCRELLAHRSVAAVAMNKSTRLILAQSLLELGDTAGAGNALSSLSGQQLTVGEQLNLVALRIDFLSRVNGWTEMMGQYMASVQLAEVMPPAASALTQATLALGARKIGRDDIAQWLSARSICLVDIKDLLQQRPVLKELWPAETVQAAAPAVN